MSSASALAFCSVGAPCHVRGVGAVGAWGTSWTPTATSASAVSSSRSSSNGGSRSRTGLSSGAAAAPLVPRSADCLNDEGCRGRRRSSPSSLSSMSMSSKDFPGPWRSRSHRRKVKPQQQQQQQEERQQPQRQQQGRRQWKPLSGVRGLLLRRREQRATPSTAAGVQQAAGAREQATTGARKASADLELPKHSGVLLLPPLSVVASVAKETEQAFAAAGRAVVDASRPSVPFVQSLVRWEAIVSGLVLVAAPILLRSWARAESEHHDTLECRNVVQTYLIAAAGCVCAVLAAVAGNPVCAVILQVLWRGAAARSLWTWSDLGRDLTKTPGWLHASVARWRRTATWVAVAGVAARILMLLVAATGIWTGVAGGLSAPTLDFLPAWLVRAASRPDESFGLSAAQLGLGVGIYAWVAYYLCFFLPYRVLYEEYQSYDRRTAQVVKDMGNGQEYNVVLSTKLGPEFPKHLIRRMARMPPGDDRDTLGLAGIVRQRAGSHTVAKAAQNVKNKEGKWGVKMMPVKFGDMRFWGSSLFERLEKQERRDEKTGWKKPDAPGSGDYRDNRVSYAKNMREIKVELGKTDAEMQNDPELSMLNLRNFDPDAEGGDFDLVLQDELTNQGGIDAAGKNLRMNNPHEMVVTTDTTPAERERDAGVLPDDGDLPAPVVSDSGVDGSEQQTVRSTDDVSYNSGDTAGKALEDSIRSRSSPPEKKIADKMTPATATRDSQDGELKRQKEKNDETGQESVAAAVGQAPRMNSRREAAATSVKPPVVSKPGSASASRKDSGSAENSSSKEDPVVDKKEAKAGNNDEISTKSNVSEEKAPQDSSFPWNALADSIRSVTRDIEKEERKEESKREKAVDAPDQASSPVVSKPGSDSGGKEGSSVDESQGKSGRSADKGPPTSGEAAGKDEGKETPSKASPENNTDVVTPAKPARDAQGEEPQVQKEPTSEKPIDASSPKVSKPVSASGSKEVSSVDRSDLKTRESTEQASSKSDDAAGKSVDTSSESSASSKEKVADEATPATATTDARDEEQEQQDEPAGEKPVDVVTDDSPSKVPVVSKPESGSGWGEGSGVDSSQQKDVGSTDESGSDSDTPGGSREESTESSESSKEDVTEVRPDTATPDTGDEQEQQQSSANEKPIATAADESPPKAPVVSKPGSGSGWEKDSGVDSGEKKDLATGDQPGSESGDMSEKAVEDSDQSSASSVENAAETAPVAATPAANDEDEERPQASTSEKPVDIVADDSPPKAPVVSKPGSGSGWDKAPVVDSSEEKDVAGTDETDTESGDTPEKAVKDSDQSTPSSKENAAEKVTPATATPAAKDGNEEQPQAPTGEKSAEVTEDSPPKAPVVSKPGSGSGWDEGPSVDSSEQKDVESTDEPDPESGDTSGKSPEDSVQLSASSKEIDADAVTPAAAAQGSKDEEQERRQPSSGDKSVDTVADNSLPKMPVVSKPVVSKPVVSKPGSGSGWEKYHDVDSSEAKSGGSTDEPGAESEDPAMKTPEESTRSSSSSPADVAEPVAPATAATHDTQEDDEGQQEHEPTSEEPTEDRTEDTSSAGSGSDADLKEDLGMREGDEMASKRETEEDVKFPWYALADSIRAKPSLEGDVDDTTVPETIPVDGKGETEATTDSPPAEGRRDDVEASLDEGVDDSSPVLSDAGSGSDSAPAEDFSITEDFGLDDEGDDWLLVLSPNGAGVLLEEDFGEEEDEQQVARSTDEMSAKSDVPSGKPMEDLIRSRASARSLPDTVSSAIPVLDGSILSHMQSFSLAHMLFQEWLLPIKGVTEEEEGR